MHACDTHRGAYEADENQPGLPITFHEESAGSGTFRAGSAPERNVCVLTIVPMLHFGQLSLDAVVSAVSRSLGIPGSGCCAAAGAGINDLQISTLSLRAALAGRPK